MAVGPLRAAFIDHFAPFVQDVVICGLNRDYLTALVFADVGACRRHTANAELTLAEVAAHSVIRPQMERLLCEFAQKGTGSSNRIERLIILDRGPDIDKSEMTDKGSINQRAVLANRGDVVEALYGDDAGEQVIRARQRLETD